MHPQPPWVEGELLAFDLETTGVDRFSDVPVAFALVTVVAGVVTSRRTGLVDPGRAIPTAATAVHGITTERARAEGVPLVAAVTLLADTLVEASRRGVPLVGMKLDYDLTILDVQCRRVANRGLVEQGFEGPVIDTLVLDRHFDRYRKGRRTLADLCAHYEVVLGQAHDAAADAEAAVGVLLAMSRRFPEMYEARIDELHRSQAEWHRQWVDSLSEWRRSKGLTPLDQCDGDWPIAVVGAAAPEAAPPAHGTS